MALQEKVFTVSEVARLLEITTGRVRQICRELNIGEVKGKTRLLTVEDIQHIEKRPDRRQDNGRPARSA
jgi:hypothetical protein